VWNLGEAVRALKFPSLNEEGDSILLSSDKGIFSENFPFSIRRARCNREVVNVETGKDRFLCRPVADKHTVRLFLNQKSSWRIERLNIKMCK
jgi:hypothetical protein